jgi:DNA-binding FrmR family transcriptional regulator
MSPDARFGGAGLGRYLREAFLFRWNLLAFLGGVVAAAISPMPDVILPLIGAAELVYLGGLISTPRFRKAIDARVYAESRGGAAVEPGAAPTLQQILDGLEPAARRRFEELKARCLEMQRLADGVRGHGSGAADDVRTPALDKLLWAFLRVLSSQQALQHFLATSDEAELKKDLEGLKDRQAQAKQRGDERIVRALTDSIATVELRLENHAKATSNSEFLGVELDRIEGKIQALVEMSVSHQDADMISSQVDSVAASMSQTEQAVREINQITGLGEQLSEPPPILAATEEQR